MLGIENSNARQSGVLALRWQKRDQHIVKPLIERLKDPAPGVRGAAAWVLGQLDIEESLDALKEAITEEENSAVKKTLEEVLGAVRKPVRRFPHGKRELPRLPP